MLGLVVQSSDPPGPGERRQEDSKISENSENKTLVLSVKLHLKLESRKPSREPFLKGK